MRFSKKIILISLMFCWAWCAASSARADTLDRIVAKVNDDIILYGDLQDQIKMLEKASNDPAFKDPDQRPRIEREVLKNMVRQRLTEQEVKRLKISVGKTDVDSAINDIKRENGFSDAQLEFVLSREGRSLSQLREKVRQELERSKLIEKVVKSKILITENQINERLRTQVGKGEMKEGRRLAMIYLPAPAKGVAGETEKIRKQAEKIHGQLKGGAAFDALAKEFSQGPGAREGGDIGFLAPEELSPEIEQATRGLAAGSFTDVVSTSSGFYILKVLEVRRETQVESELVLKEKIRRQLYLEEVNRKYEEWIKELESKSFIQVTL
jgi:peptidyl-prolyl cis-trans isomerase SurA